MKHRFRLPVAFCLSLGSLLLGSAAWAQQDPRAVIVTPPATAKAAAQRAPATPKRYWADYAGKAIRRSNLDGSNIETLATGVQGPYGTSYDPETGYVLWTSSGDEVVQMAPANGVTGSSTTLNSSFEEYFAITVPGSDVNVAYAVMNGQVVRITQNRTTGAEQTEVLMTLPSPDQVRGLALTPDKASLYLGDSAGRMTQKLNLTNRQVIQLVYDNSAPVSTASMAQPSAQEKTR